MPLLLYLQIQEPPLLARCVCVISALFNNHCVCFVDWIARLLDFDVGILLVNCAENNVLKISESYVFVLCCRLSDGCLEFLLILSFCDCQVVVAGLGNDVLYAGLPLTGLSWILMLQIQNDIDPYYWFWSLSANTHISDEVFDLIHLMA